MSRAELARITCEARDAGKTVVLTNGCFDILHVGHVRYLRQAREMGNMLIVGLNTDESVHRIKGPDRPVNTECDRAEVLAALESVDYITLFGEDTPIELILAIKPDIQVKGGDYVAEDMPEADAMRSIGGRIEIIPFSATDSHRYSTTGTLRAVTGEETEGTF